MQNHPGDRPVYRAMGNLGGIAGALLFPALVGVVAVLGAGRVASREAGEVAAARYQRLAEIKREQMEIISSSAWVDEGAGQVRVPVKAALELVVPDLQTRGAKASSLIIPGRVAEPAVLTPEPESGAAREDKAEEKFTKEDLKPPGESPEPTGAGERPPVAADGKTVPPDGATVPPSEPAPAVEGSGKDGEKSPAAGEGGRGEAGSGPGSEQTGGSQR